MEHLKIALCQMTSVDDVQTNIDQAFSLIQQIKGKVALISLPENCLYLRTDDKEKVPEFRLEDKVFAPFVKFAQEHRTFIHLGSVPLKKGDELYSTSVIISDSGKLSADYSKIHLFDVDVEGARSVRESHTYAHGEHPKVIEIHGWKVGLSICYDLRFSELFLDYSKYPVDLILLPAAFLVPTGKAHWDILLRARAIESQSFVAAAAQCGKHIGKVGERTTYGHSMVIDPWGTKMVEAEEEIGIIEATLEKSRIQKVRRQIPMKNHRRLN
ncbi:MAG: hypothetical protein A4S09_12880 [Proteobacteria bacterium SG_bin7]|nr:MAG: hypothetical protein A4S09_12880 [Proteobacteria bacterium SG_bin7]